MKTYYERIIMRDTILKTKSRISSTVENAIKVHPHWHKEVEILYLLKGQAKQQVNEKIFIAESGDMVIINKDQLHSTYSYNGNVCEIIVLIFDPDYLLNINTAAEKNLSNIYQNSIIYNNPIKTLDFPGSELKKCIMEVNSEMQSRKDGYRHIVISCLSRITGLLERSNAYTRTTNTSKEHKVVKHMLEKTFDLIDEHYNENITLTSAAEISNISVPHFCRLFKNTTGMTFKEYLTFYRINRSEVLLYTNKTMAEIAFECGFGSVTTFIRNFKKYKSCTPSTFLSNSN